MPVLGAAAPVKCVWAEESGSKEDKFVSCSENMADREWSKNQGRLGSGVLAVEESLLQ